MGAVVSNAFGGFEEALAEINGAAFLVPTVGEIVDNVVLVFFANQVVEHAGLLVVVWHLFQRNYFIAAESLNDLVPHLRVDVFSKVTQERLILVLVEVF